MLCFVLFSRHYLRKIYIYTELDDESGLNEISRNNWCLLNINTTNSHKPDPLTIMQNAFDFWLMQMKMEIIFESWCSLKFMHKHWNISRLKAQIDENIRNVWNFEHAIIRFRLVYLSYSMNFDPFVQSGVGVDVRCAV